MIKEVTCRRLPEWLTPSCTWVGEGGGQCDEESGKFENLCLEVHFDDRKVIWLEATVCTLYFNKSLLKICSLQDEFLWEFMYKMLHDAFRSISTCYIAVSCLACNLIEL